MLFRSNTLKITIARCRIRKLRLQTSRDGIYKSNRGLGGAILIVDLHELNFGELLEVIGEQICDGVGCTGAIARPCEIDVCHTVDEFKTTIAGEAIR